MANTLAEQLKANIEASRLKLTLGIIQVGNHPSSTIYIHHKVKMAQSLGIDVNHNQLPETIPQEELLDILHRWNSDSVITGYIVQLPLPTHLDPDQIINAISPIKDVDGLTAVNKGALSTNRPGILPATTRGILSLLDYYDVTLSGKQVVVLGRSNLVGLPTALALIHRDATVTVLHSKSKVVKPIIKAAEIIITAVGQPNYLNRDVLSPDAIVIDVGITSVNGKLLGDVDYNNAKDAVHSISPVPGGVGPLTVISLFQNLYEIARE